MATYSLTISPAQVGANSWLPEGVPTIPGRQKKRLQAAVAWVIAKKRPEQMTVTKGLETLVIDLHYLDDNKVACELRHIVRSGKSHEERIIDRIEGNE